MAVRWTLKRCYVFTKNVHSNLLHFKTMYVRWTLKIFVFHIQTSVHRHAYSNHHLVVVVVVGSHLLLAPTVWVVVFDGGCGYCWELLQEMLCCCCRDVDDDDEYDDDDGDDNGHHLHHSHIGI